MLQIGLAGETIGTEIMSGGGQEVKGPGHLVMVTATRTETETKIGETGGGTGTEEAPAMDEGTEAGTLTEIETTITTDQVIIQCKYYYNLLTSSSHTALAVLFSQIEDPILCGKTT